MAERLFFKATPKKDCKYEEVMCKFQYFNGFALSQRQRCIESLHKEILLKAPEANVLEVSTKSTKILGKKLSAFNLLFNDKSTEKLYPLENIFQSSKVFENGGPYLDLLDVHPREAKRDERLKTSGQLIGFKCLGITFPLEPKTMFYDWIYINALNSDKKLSKEIMKYDIFTDIEFNHKKSINCQARSAAIFCSLTTIGKVDIYLNDINIFKRVYGNVQIKTE